jgi:hypothetical protein
MEERLKVESNEYARAELQAKRAAYLARTGAFDEARAEIAAVRSIFGDGRSGRVTALLMVAEGLLLHFESLSAGALDRVLRAQVLAQAGRDSELIALSSAWKAYLEFERSDFESSARSIGLAITTAAESDSAALSRVAAVLFIAYALCGDLTAAQKYFHLGRDYALKEGDQAGLDALLHNKAVFTAAHLRAISCVEHLEPSILTITRTEVNSARNLQQLARIQSLAAYIDLADARLAILEGKYAYALDRLEKLQGTGPFPKGHFGLCLGLIEQAYCLGRIGKLDEATGRLHDAREADLSEVDADDRLVASWQLLEFAKLDRRFGSIEKREVEFNLARSGFLLMTERVRQAFAPFAKT